MPQDHKISVVIPVYNGGLYIAKAVDSVLSQSFPAHEIIVIDDGSTDDTPKILEKYLSRIVHRRIANGGCAYARNIGIGLATGDYIAFLDSDDVWFRDRLQHQIEWIERYPDVGLFACDVAYRERLFNFRMIKRFSHLHPSLRNIPFDRPILEDGFRILMKENIIATPSGVVVKKSSLDRVGPFHQDRNVAEDYELWVRLAASAPIMLLKKTLVYKKTHNRSITSNVLFIWESHGNALRVIGDRLGEYIQKNRLAAVYRQAIADNHYRIGNLLFNSGEKRVAFKQYFYGFKSHICVYNFVSFVLNIVKKSVRILSFGLIRKRNAYSEFKLKQRTS